MTDLDKALLKQNLNDFFEDGKQTRVVNTHSPLQHWQDGVYVRQPAILLTQNVNSVPEDALHHLLLSIIVQVHVNHLHKEAVLASKAQASHGMCLLLQKCCFGKTQLLRQHRV